MKQIQQITDSPKQKVKFILEDGSLFEMSLDFKPQQLGWFITSLTYKDFTVTNLRIVTSPNMLNQFRNLIPFGIGVSVDQNQEPTLEEDFVSGRAKMYVLNRTEVELFGDILSGQVSS